jgi:outer membrane protein OmpA-like peptidoglycan-associated protein
MKSGRVSRAGVTALVIVSAGVGCGHPAPPVVSPPAPAAADLIVLGVDPETGAVGAATVTTPQGSIDLTKALEGTEVRPGQPPAPPTTRSNDDVQRLFGDALGVVAPPALRFVLYFESGSNTLIAESRAMIPQVVAALRARVSPEVMVIGHTDTTGAAAANAAAGMRRATLIRDLLVAEGLAASAIEVASHGEANLAVPTPDETAEPRNRRVEVTIR